MPLIVAKVFESYEMPAGALPVRCHVLITEQAQVLEDYLVVSLPECYTTKLHLRQRATETNLSISELLMNKLPDPGNVMSGDFGEIVTLFFLSSERTERTTLIKKWRYKQDRTKAIPFSDVIILHREDATPSARDFVICAESKQKAQIPISQLQKQ